MTKKVLLATLLILVLIGNLFPTKVKAQTTNLFYPVIVSFKDSKGVEIKIPLVICKAEGTVPTTVYWDLTPAVKGNMACILDLDGITKKGKPAIFVKSGHAGAFYSLQTNGY